MSAVYYYHVTLSLYVLSLKAYLLEVRRQRIQELLEKQQRLKDELAEAKTMLMVNPTSWSFDREFFALHYSSANVMITRFACS